MSPEFQNSHLEYMKLGKRKEVRMDRYREFFAHYVEEKLLTEIREGIDKGMTLGNEQFKEEVEVLTCRRLKLKKWAGLWDGVT